MIRIFFPSGKLDSYRHLGRFPVAYFTSRSLEWLSTVDRNPNLAMLEGSPRFAFRPARTTRGRGYGDDALHEQFIRHPHDNRHHRNRHQDGAESWPSPAESDSSGDGRLPRIGYVVPSVPWKRPAWDERLGVEFAEPRETGRTLAPLIYLESITAPPRQPLDDYAIRAFDSHGV